MSTASTLSRRSWALGLTALAVAACSRSSTPSSAGSSVPSPTTAAPVSAAFCDLHTQDKAAFHWPKLAAGSAPEAAPTWRWVNVWATWCEPCVAEMPKLVAWHDRLTAAGKRVDLALVSIDDSDADVAAFRAAHPGTPASLRIASADERAAWLASFGIGDGAIPLQLFVSPANQLRCARAGNIRDQDFAAIEQLVAQ